MKKANQGRNRTDTEVEEERNGGADSTRELPENRPGRSIYKSARPAFYPACTEPPHAPYAPNRRPLDAGPRQSGLTTKKRAMQLAGSSHFQWNAERSSI